MNLLRNSSLNQPTFEQSNDLLAHFMPLVLKNLTTKQSLNYVVTNTNDVSFHCDDVTIYKPYLFLVVENIVRNSLNK